VGVAFNCLFIAFIFQDLSNLIVATKMFMPLNNIDGYRDLLVFYSTRHHS